jgi:activator of HSP90 ATPase
VLKPIVQSVKFNASPVELFETFLDSKKHSAATGGKARISRKVGGKFTAWDGQLSGHNLLIIPNRMIVQAWRSTNFKPSDPDSILILEFSREGSGGRVDMVQANVPEVDYDGVKNGWPAYYWKPWKKYFTKREQAS